MIPPLVFHWLWSDFRENFRASEISTVEWSWFKQHGYQTSHLNGYRSSIVFLHGMFVTFDRSACQWRWLGRSIHLRLPTNDPLLSFDAPQTSISMTENHWEWGGEKSGAFFRRLFLTFNSFIRFLSAWSSNFIQRTRCGPVFGTPL